MECEIDRAPLHEALSVLVGVTERKGTMPVLANVLLRTDGRGKLLLVATDLTVMVATEIDCKSSREGGITVHGKQLAEIVAAVDTDTIKFSVDDSKAKVLAGGAQFSLAGIAERDFPKMWSAVGDFSPIGVSLLLDLVDRGAYAIASDSTRLNTFGACLRSTGKQLSMVSTDGHRCAIARVEADAPEIASSLIPKKALDTLRKAVEGTETVEIAMPSASVLIVKCGLSTIWLNLLNAQPAPVESVIRPESPINVHVPRKAFISMVKRVAIAAGAAGTSAGGVKLTLHEGALRAYTESDTSTGSDFIEVPYKGKRFETGCNSKYLTDALEHIKSDEILLQLEDPLTVIQIADDKGNVQAAIMPMRIAS